MRRFVALAAVLVLGAPAAAPAASPGGTAPATDFCAGQWPDSDVMREYCRQTQRRAGERLERFAEAASPGSADAARLERCAARWPRDLERQTLCLEAPAQIVGELRPAAFQR